MSEKRMLIVDAEVIKKIDENRGDMSRSEFINFLIESQLKESPEKKEKYATKEELRHLEQSFKEVLRSFLEFFIAYGLELGKLSDRSSNDLTAKLETLDTVKK